jgi:tetratricopeptide (TPR) repeat protein
MRSGWLALGAVLLLCAAFCCTQLAEVDHYWHLLAGQRILEEHRVPHVDDFTFTSLGRSWIDLHWLFQVLLASVDRLAGWSGLDALKIALIAGGFGLASLAGLRRAGPAAVAPIGLLAVLAAQERFTLRPEAASFLLLGALLLCLEIGRTRPRVLLAVPPLIALWANLHALYIVGLAVVLITFIADRLSRRRAGRAADRTEGDDGGRMLMIAAAAALPASLLTPYGIGAWALPRRLFLERIATGNVYGRNIAEFQAPFSGFGLTLAVAAFALLALLLLVVAFTGRDALRGADYLVAGSFLVLALLARRNIPLFALVALPVGGAALDASLRRLRQGVGTASGGWRGRTAPALAGLTMAVALVLIGDVVSNRFFARDGTQRYFGSGPAPGFYPEGAARFVAGRSIGGEVLNDMTMGGYLAWRWYPQRRVFIDGRLEVHSPALFTESLALQQDPRRFESAVRRLGIGAVLWSHRHSLDAVPLLRHLASSPEWHPAFVDLSAVVFVRNEEGAPTRNDLPMLDLGSPALVNDILRQIDAAERDGANRDPLPGWLRRMIPRREVPVAEVSAALFFAAVDRHEAAERLLRAAIDRAPANAILHYNLALVLARAGRDPEARVALDTALRLERGQSDAWALGAMLHLRAGDEQAALRDWAVAERHGPLPAASLQARGALRARRGEIDAAIEDYRGALRSEPGRLSARADLALLYHQRGFHQQAWQEIGRALDNAPGACAPRVAAGRLRAAEGDPAAAEGAFREAIETAPDCHEARTALASLLLAQGREDAAIDQLVEALQRGLDPAILSGEPGLRMLLARPGLRERLQQPRRQSEEARP